MIYHVVYYFDTEREARQCSCYFSSTVVKGTAAVLHGDGFDVPFHVHVLVDVVRKSPFSKDIYNMPGYHPHSFSVVEDLYAMFDYLLTDEALTPLMRYGSLAKKYKDYLRASGFNK